MCGGGLTFLFLNPCEIWLHYLATSLSTPFVLSFSSSLPSFLSYSFFLIEKKKKGSGARLFCYFICHSYLSDPQYCGVKDRFKIEIIGFLI